MRRWPRWWSTSCAARSRSAAVKAPGFGDRRKAMLQDIAILTGGQVISEEVGFKLENAVLSDLGRAKRIVVDKDNTTHRRRRGRGRGDPGPDQGDPRRDRQVHQRLRQREAAGAPGEAGRRRGGDQRRRRDRDGDEGEEGPRGGRAARDPRGRGGGHRARRRRGAAARPGGPQELQAATTRTRTIGVRIVERALEEPIRQISNNAGVEGSIVVDEGARQRQGQASATTRAPTCTRTWWTRA